MMLKKTIPLPYFTGVALLVWMGVILCNVFNVFSPFEIGKITDALEVFVQICTLFFLYQWQKKLTPSSKVAAKWLFISVAALTLDDIAFYIVIYLEKISLRSVNFLEFLSYYLPFLVGLLAQTVFLWNVVVSKIIKKKAFFKVLFCFLLFNVVVLLLFLIDASRHQVDFSNIVFSQIFTCAYKLIMFDLVILCLACSKSLGLTLLLSGESVLLASDFLFNYSAITKVDGIVAYGQFFWLTGLLLMLVGSAYLLKEKNYDIANYFKKINSIRSSLILWTFCVSVLSFVMFFAIAYAFSLVNSIVFAALPFFIVVYSIIVIDLSVWVGNYFSEPFRTITKNIDLFMDKNEKSDTVFKIDEFNIIQKFILQAFEVKEEKDKIKNELYEIAAQVAHDIRSPVSAILMLAKDSVELPEGPRILLREAARRIQEIADHLLNVSARNQSAELPQISLQNSYFLISTAILYVISEKKLVYKGRNIKINYNFTPFSTFSCMKGSASNFKRVISNLLNNAIEAIDMDGEIFVNMEVLSKERVKISIIDSGSGMSQEIIEKILSGYTISEKREGLGLGFAHARTFLDSTDGKLAISSVLGEGTTVSLELKIEEHPAWIASEISFSKNSQIIILDDDISIHSAWQSAFSSYLQLYPSLKVTCFKNALDCISYVRQLSAEVVEQTLFLVDYELIHQELNGLDVIELLGLRNAILVTSHYENEDILKRTILLGARVIPKMLVSEAELQLLDHEPASALKKQAGLVILEDDVALSGILSYLCEFRGKIADIYNEPYSLIQQIKNYDPLVTKICLDLNINSIIDGLDLAKMLLAKGFQHVYLCSGYILDVMQDIPAEIKILKSKMEVPNL